MRSHPAGYPSGSTPITSMPQVPAGPALGAPAHDVDDREHAIRQDERALVLHLLRREVRAYFHEAEQVNDDVAEDVLFRIAQAVRQQLPGHAPGAD